MTLAESKASPWADLAKESSECIMYIYNYIKYTHTHHHLQIKDDFTKTQHLTIFDLENPEISGFSMRNVQSQPTEMPEDLEEYTWDPQ